MAVTTRRGGSSEEPQIPLPPAPARRPPNSPDQQRATQPAVTFARTPAQAATGVIDYNSRMGERLYQSATTKVDEDRYDGSAEGLFPILGLIQERARKFGWDQRIMMIPSNDGNNPKYLLDHYGSISIEEKREYERGYISTHTRDAQDTYLLYECIMNLLSPEAKAKVSIWRDDYWVDRLLSGNLLLKVVIRECHLDTNATITSIRQRLASLDTYLSTVDYDIGKLNMYVKAMLDQLAARGERSTDMLSNLFTGYLAAKDKAFVAYIDKKLELYDEGIPITPDQLMLWARQKYDLLKDKGMWNAPTPEEEKIIALMAQVNKMSEKLRASIPKKKERAETSTGRGKNLKPKPEWFTKEPLDTTKPINWNGKEWHLCRSKTGGKCESYV